MGTRGKTWKWSEEAKERARGPRPASNGNTNGVTHGVSRTLAYNSWKKMMYRCYKPEHPDYKNYGGRGIYVCDRWHNPAAFVEDMGERKKGLTLERIDVEGHYEPDNCCWVPMRYQARNRTQWKHTEEGKKRIAAAASERFRGKTRESFTGKWNLAKEP